MNQTDYRIYQYSIIRVRFNRVRFNRVQFNRTRPVSFLLLLFLFILATLRYLFNLCTCVCYSFVSATCGGSSLFNFHAYRFNLPLSFQIFNILNMSFKLVIVNVLYLSIFACKMYCLANKHIKFLTCRGFLRSCWKVMFSQMSVFLVPGSFQEGYGIQGYTHPPPEPQKWAARILLECFLVYQSVTEFFSTLKLKWNLSKLSKC